MDIVRKDRSKQRIIRRIIAGSVICALVGLFVVFTFIKKPGPVSVDRERLWIGEVSQGSMLRQVRGAGILEPEDIRWISARSSGKIERILVLPGAMVSPETVVMELSNPELLQETQAVQLELNSQNADLVSLNVTLDSQILDLEGSIYQLQAELEQAELETAINQELFQEGLESELEMKRAELNVKQLKNKLKLVHKRLEFTKKANKSRLAAEDSRIAQTRARSKLLKERVEALQVKAGFAGVLQRQTVEEGQQVSVGQSLSQVADPTSLKAVVQISEHQAKDVLIGQSAKIDTRNGVMDGRVTRVDPNVEEGTVAVDVELLGEAPKGVRPDLTVEGIIEIDRIKSTIYADRPVFSRPDSAGELFKLLPGSNLAERIKVRYGRTSSDTIEVLDGLNPGDRIVLSDTSEWEEHTQIRIR